MIRRLATALAVAACALASGSAAADTHFTVSQANLTNGFMNVFELPANGGGFIFGSGWGLSDLTATFSGDDVTLGPNTIGDPNEFWYQCVGGATPPNCGGPGAPGNKTMEANLYYQNDGGLAGQTVFFSGVVLSNTLTSAHKAYAFIKDFAGDFSSFNESRIELPASGKFSISLATINDGSRHVQYGFQMVGENVWVTDVGPFGSVTIGPTVPIPAVNGLTIGLLSLLLLGGGLLAIRMRQRTALTA